MVSDNVKAMIFFGFALLWILWGVIEYFFNYDVVQIYLFGLIGILIIVIGIVGLKKMIK